MDPEQLKVIVDAAVTAALKASATNEAVAQPQVNAATVKLPVFMTAEPEI